MSTLYGIGVGPGDPELMTLKAHRLISAAKVVAYPAPDTGESFARRIAAASISSDAEEIPIRIPMRAERFPAQEVYDQAAATLTDRLNRGLDVVVLCEGDPFFYGSFMYLFTRLSSDFSTEIVPGVPAMVACAAAAASPLSARNETVTVIPGPLSDTELDVHLATGGAFAIMKVGRHLPRLRDAVTRAGLADQASYISHASLPEQRVLPLKDAPDNAPYFSMILIPGADPYAS